jgi:hypothetical protein
MRNRQLLAACVIVLGMDATWSDAQTINWVYIPPDGQRVGECYGNCGAGCGGFPNPCAPGGDHWQNLVPTSLPVPDIVAGEPHCNGGFGWISWWQRYTAKGRYIYHGYASDGCRLHDSICRSSGSFLVCFASIIVPGSAYCSGASPAIWWYDYTAIGWGAQPIDYTFRDPAECPFGVDY